MRTKFSSMWRVAVALVLVLSLGLVMAVPASAVHTSSATIAFATGESNVVDVGSVLDVEVTNGAASADDISVVEIDFTDSDFTVTATGAAVTGWTPSGPGGGVVVTYTKDSGGMSPGASVTFSPVVTNPAEAGDAVVPAVLTTDAGTKAALDAALDTGWIGYVADSVGVGGNNITVKYVDPGFPSQDLSVSVAGMAITVDLATDGGGVLTSTASEVAAVIEGDTGGAADLVDAAADGGHLAYVVQPLTVPAFTGGTSPDIDKDCTVTPGTLTVIGPLPTVDNVQPGSGNAGETMWVAVGGTNFVEGNTSFDFGTTEVSVVAGSYHYVSPTEVDCQITISKAGAARYVIPTTSREGTNTTAQFDPNAALSAQVDVWDTYTPEDALTAGAWDEYTLVMTKDVQTTISSAIGAADGADILIAHPATYSPTAQVLVDEAVTIRSLTGLKTGDGSAEDTIIDCTAVDISTGAIHIGIDGVVIQGLTIMDTTTTFGSKSMGLIASNNNDVTVKNCVITGAEWIAIGLGGTLTATTIQDNTISNSLGWAIVAIESFDVSAAGALDIRGNTITGCGIGLLQYLPDLYGVIGIRAPSDQDLTGVSIENNVIADNDAVGLIVDKFSPGKSPVIRYNDIYNNGSWGIYCLDTDGANAKYNYWGAIGGPSAGTGVDASTALGSGEPISHNVTYDPWLTETQSTTVTAGKAYLGSTMELDKAGWNTLSVPLALKGSANNLTEIAALGDFLTSENWETAYQYDPGSGWVTPTELVPGRGYYIKTLEAAVSFPVLYSGQLGLPAFELAAGWNLVGSAFGIAETDRSGDYGIAAPSHTTDGRMLASVALDSIKASCSVIVSPTVPGQEDSWALTYTALNSGYMYVGEAYWVFMTAPNVTLAGFEVTPIYKLFLE